MTLPSLHHTNVQQDEARSSGAFARIGDPAARLLAGPASTAGAEALESHLARLGSFDLADRNPEALRVLIQKSGLVGRGGGEFPLSRKLGLAMRSPGVPIVVVNASEGEPASCKDATLIRLRPHLVLDGAETVARAVGAEEVVVYVHAERVDMVMAIERAITERRIAGDVTPTFRVVEAPDRYVAGEATAVVAFLDRGHALPRRSPVPAAESGVAGRPTIVSNTETYAHVALLVRKGVAWFRESGSQDTPGSTLLTLAGAVNGPGTVVEVLRPVALGTILSVIGGIDRPPSAVLLGGYAGTWVDGSIAWNIPVDRHALRLAGAPLGCGLVAVLDHDDCGVAETARLLDWMADQSAGQCGPCVTGLPTVADFVHDIVEGQARHRDLKRLRHLAVSIRGRGACGHPTGAMELLESALDTFADEIRRHLRGSVCCASGLGLPLGPQVVS